MRLGGMEVVYENLLGKRKDRVNLLAAKRLCSCDVAYASDEYGGRGILRMVQVRSVSNFVTIKPRLFKRPIYSCTLGR